MFQFFFIYVVFDVEAGGIRRVSWLISEISYMIHAVDEDTNTRCDIFSGDHILKLRNPFVHGTTL